MGKAAWALPGLCVTASAWSCIEFNGDARQGALLWGRVAAGSTVTLDDEVLRVSQDGVVVLGFGRDESGTRTLRVERPTLRAADAAAVAAGIPGVETGAIAMDGPDAAAPFSCRRELVIAPRAYRIQHVDGVPQRTVTPDPEDLARIRREAALVAEARRKSRAATDFAGGFTWPVEGPISGVYGSQRVYNGTPGRPHFGVDVAVPTGTPITAPAPGVVVLAEPDLFYSGGTIILDHGLDVNSTFLHLSEVSVAVGQQVKPGDIIGRVGSTGRATGPHLDWRMNWRNRRVDPQLLAPPM